LTKVHDEFVNNLVFNSDTNNTYLSVPANPTDSEEIIKTGKMILGPSSNVLQVLNPDDTKTTGAKNPLDPSL
jgi:hypothetical protein